MRVRFASKSFFLPWIIFLSHLRRNVKADENSNLHGFAYSCDGTLVGLKDGNELRCGNSPDTTVVCGTYNFNPTTVELSGTFNSRGPFQATKLEFQDGILITFEVNSSTCNILSLNWPIYSTSSYLGLKCPVQNAIAGASYEENHFSLGISGDVAYRSLLEIVTGNGNTITRDSYGVFVWWTGGTIKFYFGPQQGRPLTVWQGTLTEQGGLHVEGFDPTGPCVHDGTSPFDQSEGALPQHVESQVSRVGAVMQATANPSSQASLRKGVKFAVTAVITVFSGLALF